LYNNNNQSDGQLLIVKFEFFLYFIIADVNEMMMLNDKTGDAEDMVQEQKKKPQL